MEERALYFECTSGISGDMAVAAMLDLGADAGRLKEVLKTIPASGFHVEIKRTLKSSIDVCDFSVIMDDGTEIHDHDMEYLHGKSKLNDDNKNLHIHHEHGKPSNASDSEYVPDGLSDESDPVHENGKPSDTADPAHGHDGLSDESDPVHEHGKLSDAADPVHGHNERDQTDHSVHSHHHSHIHRNLDDVTAVINGTEMGEPEKKLAVHIFTIVAQAEAEAHGLPLGEVHFHEVGAVDSIVDIIAMAVCFEDLKEKYGFDHVIIKELCEGNGTVRCQHGILPVPVPAVLNIVSAYELPITIMNGVEGEFVTPTGAAFAAAVADKKSLPERFKIIRSGYGGGKRKYERPSILRALLISLPEKDVSAEDIKKRSFGKEIPDRAELSGADAAAGSEEKRGSGKEIPDRAEQYGPDAAAGSEEKRIFGKAIPDRAELSGADAAAGSEEKKNFGNMFSGEEKLYRTDMPAESTKNVSGANAKDSRDGQGYDYHCTEHDRVMLLETNIDDSAGENLGFVLEKLFEKGALDVFYTPVFMKKNRPAYRLSVLCREEDVSVLEDVIFIQTTSIGVRYTFWERDKLSRKDEVIRTEYGCVHVKHVFYKENEWFYPEYESIKLVAGKSGKSYDEARRYIMSLIKG